MDFGEDAHGRGRPAVGFAMLVAMIQVGSHGALQVGNAAQYADTCLLTASCAHFRAVSIWT
jgi:hypothetical protein